jgi:hypothetical protein
MKDLVFIPIKAVLLCFILILISSCSETDYTKLVKSEMAKKTINDSLFLGMKFGITKQDFFDRCWELNNKRLISHSSSNNFVKYQLPIKENDSTAKIMNMLFYGIFNEDKVMTGMDLKFTYDAWALWNKSHHADVLLPAIKDSLLHWYPGNDFISVPLKKNQKEMLVKIDGNRRIIIEPLENNQEVNARIDDLRYIIDKNSTHEF